MRSPVRAASAAATVVAALVLSACWPQPGQNPDRTAHNPSETRLTTATVAGLTEAWRVDGTSQPVFVAGDVLAAGGSDLRRVDARTAAVEWTWTSPPQEGIGPTYQGTPVVADGKVLATYSQYSAGGIFGQTGQALDPATGTPVAGWSGGVTALRWPLVATETQVCPEGTCVLPQFGITDASTGVRVQGGWQPLSEMTIGEHAVYGGSFAYENTSIPTVAALPVDGTGTDDCGPPGFEILPCPTWSTPVGGAASPVVIGPGGDVVYAGTDAGAVVALDAASGALLWSTPVGAAVTQAPALADGVLYVGTGAGTLVAVDASTGAQLWSANVGSSAVATQPAVGGGGATAVVYAATSSGTVVALAAAGCGAATCSPLWSADAGAPVVGGPAVSNGTLVVTTRVADGVGELVGYRLP